MNTHHEHPPGGEAHRLSSLHHDPRLRHDDPLLDSLLVLCQLQGKSVSRTTLTAGLPLEEQRLSVNLLPRAAKRAGLQARILKRPLDDISTLSLPAMLLLREGRAAILLGWTADGSARLMTGETEGGEIEVDRNTLQQNYLGLVLFAQPTRRIETARPSHQVDSRHWLRHMLGFSRGLYWDALAASLLINFIAVFIPLFVMHIYDRVMPNQTLTSLWVLAGGIAIALLFDVVLRTLRSLCIDSASQKTDLLFSTALFERVLGMMLQARPPRVGALAHQIRTFQTLRDTLSPALLATVLDLPFMLLTLIFLWIVGGTLVWVPLLAIPFILAINWLIQSRLTHAQAVIQQLANERQAILTESLNNLDMLKIHNAQGEKQYQWEQTCAELNQLSYRHRAWHALALHLTQYLQSLSGVIVIILGVYLFLDSKVTLGALIASYLLTNRALLTLEPLSELLNRYRHITLALEDAHQLIQLPQEHNASAYPLKRERIQGSIELRDVTFSYPEQKNRALIDINLSISPGEKVGIIGRTGSGKSSLEKLVVNLYTPTHGNVLIDGLDARQLDMADLRHHVGYVPQDIQLFHGTLRDNLICGARYIDDETMLRVAEIAGVNDFARLHPDGYNLQVGERGANLSGGQRQAVAIARALLLAPPILMMDEPTSAMDNNSEDRFKQALHPVLEDKTLLLVTHRVSMLTLVDRLIILDKGRIIADGPKAIVLDALKKGQINASH
ncbi:type I secretion system permease/ATPase [Dickeya lacustris]|uniref:Type I secretion system permease/ATPase n=1 Tax=Dickeya lacustris TaxID=2259638 RepID=A0ABY8GAD8_9GAMM|nr:type I secretion system permease/ATPase [Dickeya lacustris]WFN56922.1 type I secretion system permease/ATPase [Dickeya lacustris]